MGDYKNILNPFSGGLQRVPSDEYIQSVAGGGGISDYDPYRVIYVDNTRIEAYVETGSISKPFKTIQAAVNKRTALGQHSGTTIFLIYGAYQETIYFEDYALWNSSYVFQGQHMKSFPSPQWLPAPGQTYSIISTQNNQNIRFYLDNINMGAINLKQSINNLYLVTNDTSFSNQSFCEGLRQCRLFNVSGNMKFTNCNELRICYIPQSSQYPTNSQTLTIELDNTKAKSPSFSNPMYSEIMNLGMRSLTILDDPSNVLNLRLIFKECIIGNMSIPPTYIISNLQTWYLINSFLFGSIVNNNVVHCLNSELSGTITGNTPIYGATNKPTISSGAVAPTSTPTKIGDVYLDMVAKKIYFATGTTNSSDWTIVN